MNKEEQYWLLWLERKVTELLWLTIIAGAVFIGWLTLYLLTLIVDKPGWHGVAVFIGGWLLGSFMLQRQAFRGAPKHIKYLY